MSDTQWTVYILCCRDGSLYTGITTDIERRLREHNGNTAKTARYTRSRQPVHVVYSEAALNRSLATRREREIKKLSRAAKQKLIASKSM